jgi:hypothetical protein
VKDLEQATGLTMLILAGFVPVCLSAPIPGPISSMPTAAELIDKSTQALDSFRSDSFIVKAEIVSEHRWQFTRDWHEPEFRGRGDSGKSYKRIEYRTDGKRMHSREYSWGHISPSFPEVSEEHPLFRCENYADKQHYRHSTQTTPEARGLIMLSEFDSYAIGSDDNLLQGYCMVRRDSEDRVDKVLRGAGSVAVRPQIERIGGSDCYVIDARTDGGTLSVRLDPAHGYHVARVESKTTERMQGPPGQQAVTTRLENVRFEKRGDVWVPMEADYTSMINYPGGSFTGATTHYKRTEIVLNPDHEARGSFLNPLEHPENDPLLRNGTQVRKVGDPVRYCWQDGKLMPDESRTQSAQREPPARR